MCLWGGGYGNTLICFNGRTLQYWGCAASLETSLLSYCWTDVLVFLDDPSHDLELANTFPCLIAKIICPPLTGSHFMLSSLVIGWLCAGFLSVFLQTPGCRPAFIFLHYISCIYPNVNKTANVVRFTLTLTLRVCSSVTHQPLLPSRSITDQPYERIALTLT